MNAIIGIDIQNDFVKGGALAYGYPQEDIVPSIAKFIEDRAKDGDFVILTRDTHGPDYMSTLEGEKLPVPHCIKGTPGHAIAPAIAALVNRPEVQESIYPTIVDKPTFGTFKIKEWILDVVRNGDDIEDIYLVGGCTSICLLANAVILRAAFPDKRIVVCKDLCFDIDEASHNAALAVLRNQQIDIVDSRELVKCRMCGMLKTETEIRECGCRDEKAE